ncbi:hypothetical protein Palpr_2518 [Paludibacter propionicigenes WB4]|uniref:Uncharacterized protein n=1 Tax=Paludibacter propionicigenes (strain DSM 17365 / JCM 13257 / WB4) TaxID=694427 RepID=E4T7F6_PALPW|nr:hypothetical protein Palpr_2518 [Paludibacter propionicigenes WB4]
MVKAIHLSLNKRNKKNPSAVGSSEGFKSKKSIINFYNCIQRYEKKDYTSGIYVRFFR